MLVTNGRQTSQVADALHRIRGTLDHDELDAVREGPRKKVVAWPMVS